jgi:ACR3 family arsenite transporter
MMWPVLTKVQYERLPTLFSTSKIWLQIGLSVVLNWIIGPFVMLGLAWATLPDLPTYRTGVIMVGLARCIAMVMIWNAIAKGNVEYCAIIVVFNAILQIALYSPYAIWLINVIGREDGGIRISYGDVAISVLIVRLPLFHSLMKSQFSYPVSWYPIGRRGNHSILDLAHRRKTIPN